MLKSDLPPSYEESRQQSYSPQQHGNHPYPPYAYPAQPGVYTGPGQPGIHPQAGLWQGPVYSPSAMPSMMPSFITPGVFSSNPIDTEGISSPSVWDSKSVRHAFIRKVYLILAAQLFVTASIIAVFAFVEPVRLFVIQNPAIYWASFPVYLVTYLVLVCCEGPRRRHPWNLVLLLIFTLALSYMTGTISSYFDTKAVFLALGITAIVCVIVTIFCFQTKVDFTSCTGLLCALCVVVLVTGIITSIVLSFQYVPWLHMLYGACGAIVFTLFLAYHTQLLIGNRANAISPEEYVFGALSLYVDIVQIFIFLLHITGSSSE
ncbi:protein lifeguard 3-like isoform X1 [Myxocyprinus asiaticus]|uniref:protein lifeguard 3-like isoform X1 n=1 Tax=Myxocyprinus asiaticus TaxID=70543 RepID=UPI002223D865|nr:protein lifeguard 3-like isoform X1 [Myxocyprinus asiaticus]XP_051566008.1 protein lifeguard 3-like isoform X1 [Myxocyprinus asiaticus]XP_051566009.1 protein lifeguard 3-like isoform X1 [Myxocyprinus asiaticus]